MTAAVICLRCPHSAEAHSHYRRGTDCAFCSCTQLAGKATLLADLRAHGWLIGLLLAVVLVLIWQVTA